jgi:hypothetical protein
MPGRLIECLGESLPFLLKEHEVPLVRQSALGALRGALQDECTHANPGKGCRTTDVGDVALGGTKVNPMFFFRGNRHISPRTHIVRQIKNARNDVLCVVTVLR